MGEQFQPGSSNNLAPFACHPDQSRGRLFKEAEARERTPYARDRDRIIHSGGFRKLKHKTQVFVYHEGDYYRTRLTHSLEVAQIARSVSRSLGLNEDLAETLALAHDLGHTPFGHTGEDVLEAEMENFGGFDHNDQTLRVLTRLEQRYPDFDGLNLTWETLEGVVKHNGPMPTGAELKRKYPTIHAFNGEYDLELDSYASAEAQAAALADDIAYNNHDVDDGLRAGLFEIDDLREVPFFAEHIAAVRKDYPDLARGRMIFEIVRRMIGDMVGDVLVESRRRLDHLKPGNADEIRANKAPVIAFSEEMRKIDKEIKTFLLSRMYRHYKVNRVRTKAKRVVADLFNLFMTEPNCLPREWQLTGNDQVGDRDEAEQARLVCDYIAGMTDRYALREHQRLFDVTVIK